LIPWRLRLKRPGEFRVLGKPTAWLDPPSNVSGRTVFGTDVVVPGMLAATVLQPPVSGARAAHIDGAEAKAIPGVQVAIEITGGGAIVADTLWAALQDARRSKWCGTAAIQQVCRTRSTSSGCASLSGPRIYRADELYRPRRGRRL
jgi:isoquinoline 1-oxidoreductase beta subunit